MATSPPGASRAKTRGYVLDLIRAAGTISRAELADRSGFTAPTITQVIRELMADGLVLEVGRGESTGGKPPTLLQLNARARYSVGVLLERNTCVSVVVDLVGRPVTRTSFHGAATMPPEQVFPLLAKQVEALLDTAGVERDRVLGLGLVSYGPQDQRGGLLLSPQPTKQWLDFPVAERLSQAVGLPVLLENDATAATVGEYWIGAVDPASAYACVYMASGIGGGVVVAGDVYRGSSSNSVELGHISLDVNGDECPCGNRGCLENYAGPAALIRQAVATGGLGKRLGLRSDEDDVLTDFARLAAAATGGDRDARRLVQESARYIGSAAVTLTTLFDLDRIVLAGPSFAAAGSIYQSIIQREVERRSFARRAHPTQVVLSASGSDAAAIGGAILVLRSQLTD
jgi:predicted NBD/HSP70 family sugar kinase